MNTLTFRERYVGPNGPHLNNLTQTSLTGSYKPEVQSSIHPRVHFGVTTSPKSNTAKPRRVQRNSSGFGVRRTKTRSKANWSKSK